jgi:RecA/RadA recombinase
MAGRAVGVLSSSAPPSSRTWTKGSGQLTSQSNSALDRLPTVSASQALETLHARGSRTVGTGLSQLDKHLAPHGLPGRTVAGGYTRGKVTEIFGPPGVGKTAFG